MSYIILRDIPKEEVRLDLSIYEIVGGFRGFALVPPGLHYVAVKDDDAYKSFWCFLNENEVIVKILDYESGRMIDDEENGEHYRQLALTGAMNKALKSYALEPHLIWLKLTKHISSEYFPVELCKEEAPVAPNPELPDYAEQLMNQKTRFEQTIYDLHNNNDAAFLAEFQIAFLRWFVDSKDGTAFKRWRYLLQSIYGAGDRRISDKANLFIQLVDALMVQINLLHESFLSPDSFVVSRISYLAEDMIDTGIDELVSKGKEFASYLKEKGIA